MEVTLVYFSGTGCTKAVCDCFEDQLLKLGIGCTKINMATESPFDLGETDLLVIFSPVYACRLSSIAESWVKDLPKIKNAKAAVISVSGAGEISPNTACRVRCKHLLKRKGYSIIYEKMFIMPSNFAFQATQNLNLALITILPDKVKQGIKELLSEEKYITTPKIRDRFLAIIGKAEHLGARFFGATIRASHNCNKCGLCVQSCPRNNIKKVNGVPKFGFRCIWCLKCIYNCPCNALSPRLMKFTVLKSGFDLKEMTEQANKEPSEIEFKYHKNILWQGVIDYIQEE